MKKFIPLEAWEIFLVFGTPWKHEIEQRTFWYTLKTCSSTENNFGTPCQHVVQQGKLLFVH